MLVVKGTSVLGDSEPWGTLFVCQKAELETMEVRWSDFPEETVRLRGDS